MQDVSLKKQNFVRSAVNALNLCMIYCKVNARIGKTYAKLKKDYVRLAVNALNLSTLNSTQIYENFALNSMQKYVRSPLNSTQIHVAFMLNSTQTDLR